MWRSVFSTLTSSSPSACTVTSVAVFLRNTSWCLPSSFVPESWWMTARLIWLARQKTTGLNVSCLHLNLFSFLFISDSFFPTSKYLRQMFIRDHTRTFKTSSLSEFCLHFLLIFITQAAFNNDNISSTINPALFDCAVIKQMNSQHCVAISFSVFVVRKK